MTRNFLLKISYDGPIEYYNEDGSRLSPEEVAAVNQMIEAQEISTTLRDSEIVRYNPELKMNMPNLVLHYYDAMKTFINDNRNTLIKLAIASMEQQALQEAYDEDEEDE